MSKNNREHKEFGVYLGLGSNLGDRKSHILRALETIESHSETKVICATELMETEPWGPVKQPSFLNAVVKIETSLQPLPLLRLLKSVELRLGREPGAIRWGPRIIDIDILIFENLVIDTAELTIPHARMTERRFVLQQLLELDSGLIDPRSGVLLREFLRI